MDNLSIIKDTKFKSIYISVRFLSELKKENVLTKMLLANILNESCKKYPNKRAVTQILDTMYGAIFSVNSSVIGKAQVISCKVQIVDPSYLKEDNQLLEDIFALLHEFITNPLLNENGFDKNVFDEAKQNLKDVIVRGEDDPSTYCMYEAMRKAGENQPLGNGVYGNIQDVEAITMEDVVNAYHEMINNNAFNILVLGNVKEEEIRTYTKHYLNFRTTKKIVPNYCLIKKQSKTSFVEQKDISQSYITNLYTTNIKNDDKTFASLKVANAILGQLPTSLLFREVREKHSLCYSIYSALYPYDGVLGISTGVEVKEEEKTLLLIDEQINKMKQGDFNDEMIVIAKQMLVNTLRSTFDNVDAIFGFTYRNLLFHKKDSIEDMIKEIEEVTKEDVMNAMNKCELCVSYIVKGVECV